MIKSMLAALVGLNLLLAAPTPETKPAAPAPAAAPTPVPPAPPPPTCEVVSCADAVRVCRAGWTSKAITLEFPNVHLTVCTCCPER